MRKFLFGCVASIALCAPASVVGAQDASGAAWAALMATPAGALPPMFLVQPASAPALRTVYQLRYGHWKLNGANGSQNNFGAAVSIPSRKARWNLELGLGNSSNCNDCGHILLAGVDATIPLTASQPTRGNSSDGVFSLAIDPFVGLGKPVGGDDNDGFAFSAGARLPISVSFKVGERAYLAPFLTPGAGLGHINTDNDSETGFRFMLGGGVTLAEITPGLQLTGSFHKIFIDEGPTLWGLGLSIAGR